MPHAALKRPDAPREPRAVLGASPRGSAPERRRWALLLTAFAVVWFTVLAASAVSTPAPVVLSDEATYLLTTLYGYQADNFARWAIISQIPDLLYYRIYNLLPHAHLYTAAKLLNAGFIAASAMPAYRLASAYLPPREAAFFAALVICAPICTFARYFMPESLYYFGFWWTMHGLLRTLPSGDAPSPRHREPIAATVAGICLGLLSLVKPHAVALVIAVAAFFLLRSGRATTRIASMLTVVAGWYLVRTGTAYALTGILDVSISGPTYASLLVRNVNLAAVLRNFSGHAASVLLLIGLPVAVVTVAMLRRRPRTSEPVLDLGLLALCVLGALVAMTVYFSSTLHGLDPIERIERLHGRYYAYAMPLLILACLALSRRDVAGGWLGSRRALFGLVAASLVGWYVVASWYEVTVIDYPELGVFMKWPNGLVVPATATIACLWVVFRVRRGTGDIGAGPAAAITWWAVIAVTTSSLLLVAPFSGKFFVSAPIDHAMMDNEALRRLHHRPDGMVIGTRAAPADAFRVMFHLESLSRGLLVDTATTVGARDIAGGTEWLILLPGVAYSGSGALTAFGLVRYVQLR